jgi:hypothetical protein
MRDLKLRFQALPMRLAWRASSSTRRAWSRTAKNLLPLFQQRRRVFGENLFRLRELRQMHAGLAAFDGLGRYSQTSSAVKLRMGATSRTSASVICHSTVCAERRSWLVGAKVYMRSLSTSR